MEDDIGISDGYSAYVPIGFLKEGDIAINRQIDIAGTRYKLNKDYVLEDQGTKRYPKVFRKWNKVDVIYAGRIFAMGEACIGLDSDQNIVFAI